jgi:predicted outer membrane repeat protein
LFTKKSISRVYPVLLVSVIILALLAFGAVGQVSAASIIYVKASASGLNKGTSWTNAYKSLQSALGFAVSGDQIWVAAGTYKPTGGTNRAVSFTLKNGVAVYGGFAGTETSLSQRNITANVTILSGDIGTAVTKSDNSYHVVNGGTTDNTAILDGFTITAGNANGFSYPQYLGGGIFNAFIGPTMRNLVLSGNSAGDGGGMYILNNIGSNAIVTNVTFSANSATNGGGLDISGYATLTNVTFNNNSAIGYGGGIQNYGGGALTLVNVVFKGNSAANGGGMQNDQSSATLSDVSFSGNSASLQGGGIYNYTSNPTLKSVTFNSNLASNNGGGMYNENSSPTLTNATFSGNSATNGGGMENYNTSSATLKNVTFKSNSASNGGGMYNYSSSPTLTNATFSGNTASLDGAGMDNENSSSPYIFDSIFWNDGSAEIWNSSPGLTIADSIVAGGCPAGSSTCSNILNANPALGPLQNNGGFTKTMALGAGSPAIDAGKNATCTSKDQRGVTRPQGAACDIGAYEVKVMSFTSVATYDGWALESAKASNIGGSLNSTATTVRVGDDSSNRRYRGFLSFNTAPLPDGAAVVIAEVRIKKQSIVGSPFNTQGALLTDLVKPYFGSSLTLVNSDWQAAATVSSVGYFIPDGSSYWAPLYSSGRSNINKTGTTQFRLRFSSDIYNGAADYLAFYSGDYTTNTSYRPLLIVYYNP